jgi:hypothetical protein
MTLIVPLLLAFAVIVIAGGSLRRKGRWSARTYYAWVTVAALVCLAVAALIFLPRSTAP